MKYDGRLRFPVHRTAAAGKARGRNSSAGTIRAHESAFPPFIIISPNRFTR